MSVFTGHTCNSGGYSGSRPKAERQRDCQACQRLAEFPAPATERAKPEDVTGAHDASNLRLYARLFEEHKWQDPVIHWGVFHQTLNEVSTRIERLRAIAEAAQAVAACGWGQAPCVDEIYHSERIAKMNALRKVLEAKC